MRVSKNLSDMSSETKKLHAQIKDLNEIRNQVMKQNGDLRQLVQEQKKKFIKLMKDANDRINMYKNSGYLINSTENIQSSISDQDMDIEAQFDPSNLSKSTSSTNEPKNNLQNGVTTSISLVPESEAISPTEEPQITSSSKENPKQNFNEQGLSQQLDLLHYYLDEMHNVMETCPNCAPKLLKIFDTQEPANQTNQN